MKLNPTLNRVPIFVRYMLKTFWIKVWVILLGSTHAYGTTTASLAAGSFSGQRTSGNSQIYYYSNISRTIVNSSGVDYFVGSANGDACDKKLNPNCLIASNPITVKAKSDKGGTGSGQLYLIAGAASPAKGFNFTSNSVVTATTGGFAANQEINLSATWADICTKAINGGVSGLNANCTVATQPQTAALGFTLSVVGDVDGGGTYNDGDEVADMTIQIMSSIKAYASASALSGLYTWFAFPGDMKVRFKGLGSETAFPDLLNGIGINAVRFFFEADLASTSCDASIFGRVNIDTSLFHESGVEATTGSLKNIEAANLTNGVWHYFRLGLVDFAGNLGYITPTEDDTCDHAARPDEVLGLIKDNECFVATVSFPPEHQHFIKILREFRDHVLLKSIFGQKLVSKYYEVGPGWAHWIKDRPAAKNLARLFLYPFVGFSYVAIHAGALNASVLLASLLLFPLLLLKATRRAKIFLILFFIIPTVGRSQEDYDIQKDVALPSEKFYEEQEAIQRKVRERREEFTKGDKPRDKVSIDDLERDQKKINESIGFRRKEYTRKGGSSVSVKQSYQDQTSQTIEKKLADGTYIYNSPKTPISNTFTFKYGAFTPNELVGNSGRSYSEIYGTQSATSIVSLEYEKILTKEAGKIGLQVGLSVFFANGRGVFASDQNAGKRPDETVNLFGFPLFLNGIYKAQYWDFQPVIPYGGAGIGYIPYLEFRNDKKFGEAFKRSGAPVAQFFGGVAFQLDFLDQEGLWQLDTEYGINHIYLTLAFKKWLGLSSGTNNFSSSIFEGGVIVEF